jgi:hypothetical protein
MPNMWILLVLEMGAELHVLSSASWHNVDLNNQDEIEVVVVIFVFGSCNGNLGT